MMQHIKSEWNAFTTRMRLAFGSKQPGTGLWRDLIGIALLCLFTALLCAGEKAALDLYLGLALASALLFAAITFACRLFGSSRSFAYSTMLMIAVGLALQVLLFSSGSSGLSRVHSLIVFGFLGLAGGLLLILGFRAISGIRRQWCYLLLGGGTLLIYLLLWVAGIAAGNTKAWLMIGSFSFQPTELAKVLGLLTVARLLTDEALSPKKRLWGVVLTLLLHTAFLVSINELGTLLILMTVSLLLTFLYLPKTKHLLLLLLILVLIAALLLSGCYGCHKLAALRPAGETPVWVELGADIFQKIELRLKNLLDPANADPYGAGYQSYQVRRVLSTAKLFGCCPSQAVPVIDSDFIYIYLISHFGILAAIGVVLLLILMTFKGTVSLLRRQAGTETATALAFMLCLTVSSLLSALSALCLLPTVGIGFAFLSRGGTASAVNHMMLLFILYGMRCPQKQLKRGEKHENSH